MKTCPYCAEQIQDAAIKCRYCGEDLGAESSTVDAQPTLKPMISPGFLKGLGVLLFFGGVVASVYFFAYFERSVVVPSVEVLGQAVGGGRVQNLGLMQDRQLGLIVSIVVALLGLVAAAMANRQGSS